jgi:hypothetical protein
MCEGKACDIIGNYNWFNQVVYLCNISYGERKMPSCGSKALDITKVSLKRKGGASLKKIAKWVNFF